MEDNIEKIGESKDDKEEHPATDEKQPSSKLDQQTNFHIFRSWNNNWSIR